jgi:hypothetical protein
MYTKKPWLEVNSIEYMAGPIIIQSRLIPPPFSVIGRLVHYFVVDRMEDINLGVAHKR